MGSGKGKEPSRDEVLFQLYQYTNGMGYNNFEKDNFDYPNNNFKWRGTNVDKPLGVALPKSHKTQRVHPAASRRVS